MKKHIILSIILCLSAVLHGNAVHQRIADRTLFLAESPLSTTYSNGNMWTGYTSRWLDMPLVLDRSIKYLPGRYYQVTASDFRKTLELMSSYGLDGVVFNQSRSCFYKFTGMKNIPARMVPCLLLSKSDAEQEKLIAEMLKNPAGIKINGKSLILSYWTSRRNSPEQLKRKLAYLRSKYGDFLFVPDVCSLGNKWGRKFRNKELRESDHSGVRELIRSYLRVADGVYFGELNSLAKVADSERVFDADTYRDFILKTIVGVLNEPEFKGKKLFGAAAGPGHANSYTLGNSVSSSGTAALRKSLTAVLAYDPDFVVFFEWDEWNENTCIRPTLWNSYAHKRIIGSYIRRHRKQTNLPLAGDDTSIPNLIISFRKTLALGEKSEFEILNIPDTSSRGEIKIKLSIYDENGKLLKTFAKKTLDSLIETEHRFFWGSEEAGNACALLPELEVTYRGRKMVFRDGLPHVEIRPTATYDAKWALMPLRDLLADASCTVKFAGSCAGKQQVEISASAPLIPNRIEVLDGGDIIESHTGNPTAEFRENQEYYVFSIWQFCRKYTSTQPKLSVSGVSEASWLIGTEVKKGKKITLNAQATYTPDTYLRIKKSEIPNARLTIVWQELKNAEIKLADVVTHGAYSIGGEAGFNFTVHRFLRQPAFFDAPEKAKLQKRVELISDLPVAVVHGQVISPAGKIFRSRPVVVGERSGVLVPVRVFSAVQQKPVTVMVDKERVPVLSYDLSPRRGVLLSSNYAWAFNGMCGNTVAAATRRNRGGASFGTPFDADRKFWTECNSYPAQRQVGGIWQLDFDGKGAFAMLPHGAIPRNAAYRFSFEFKPDDPERKQEIFASGTGSLYGIIAYMRLEKGFFTGKVVGIHPKDANFRSVEKVRKGQWNKVEFISYCDSIELILNGVSSGRIPVPAPARYDTASWFGGRRKLFFKGSIRNIRISHVDPAYSGQKVNGNKQINNKQKTE